MAGPSTGWTGSHIEGAEFAAMSLGVNQYQGITSYGTNTTGGYEGGRSSSEPCTYALTILSPDVRLAPYSDGGWQPTAGTTYAGNADILSVGCVVHACAGIYY